MSDKKQRPYTPSFLEVKAILDTAIANWATKNNRDPNLGPHGPTFKWDTKSDLLAAVGHNFRLIQPEVIGNGMGENANLIVDLRRGIQSPVLRMPKGGPFVDEADIQKIQDWIDAGCPD
jgi:hypothetical protein